jgi:hypothetical protein
MSSFFVEYCVRQPRKNKSSRKSICLVYAMRRDRDRRVWKASGGAHWLSVTLSEKGSGSSILSILSQTSKKILIGSPSETLSCLRGSASSHALPSSLPKARRRCPSCRPLACARRGAQGCTHFRSNSFGTSVVNFGLRLGLSSC